MQSNKLRAVRCSTAKRLKMELEAEARRQFFKEQMEAEDAPQLLLLG